MKTDIITNISSYRGISKDLDVVIDYIVDNDYCTEYKEGGRIDSRNFFNLCVFEGKTVLNEKFEAHKKYIDLQYVLEGIESFEYALPKSLVESDPYDEKGDIYFLKGQGAPVDVPKGSFVLFFPDDAHRGGLGSLEIKKLVFKIAV